MPDKPVSPFSGLDKVLLRSTKVADIPSSQSDNAEASAGRPTPQRRLRSTETSYERSSERTNERTKIRHSFDIYQDQLLRLTEVQADVYRRTGKKPKIGELVQEALDAYIERYDKRKK